MTSNATKSHAYRHPYPGLTALNLATSAAYTRCVTSGGHVDSGDTVTRTFPGGERTLPVCARCGCPYQFPRVTWNGVAR